MKPSLISRIKAAYSGFLHEGAYPTRNQRPRNIIISDTKKSVSPGAWRYMLSYARQIFANYGPARAPVLQLATYSIGNAWAPIFKGQDMEWGARATEWLKQWMKICDVRGTNYDFKMGLKLTSMAIDRDGDVGLMLTESADGYPQIQYIPAHRIRSLNYETIVMEGGYKGLQIYNGVIFNEINRPVAYRIASEDGQTSQDISARDMMLIYSPEWHDQGRGLTAYAHAILDLQDAQDVKEYEKRGVKLGSSIGMIEKSDTGDVDPGEDFITLSEGSAPADRDLYIEDVDGGAIRYFKSGTGAGLDAFVSQRPSPAWSGFMEHLLRNVYAGMDWPYEMAWDISKLGGASVRAVFNKAQRTVDMRQDLIETSAVRTASYAIAKAIKRGDLPASDEWWKWSFRKPAKLSVDAGRDAMQNREDIRAGIRTIEEDAGERGETWDEIRKQAEIEADDLLVRARRLADAHGISLEMAINLLQQKTPNGNMPAATPAPAPEPSGGGGQAAAEMPPMTFNLELKGDAAKKASKQVTFQRGEDGSLTGAAITED